MINLFKLVKLHFNIRIDPKIQNILDHDLVITPEELAIYIYRLQNEIINLNSEKEFKDILLALSYLQRMYTQIEIYYSAEIGKNFRIIHGLGTVIGARVKIKDNVTIYQNVTLGDTGTTLGRPIIENDVKIYSGAKVIGSITIGRNSIIGANSVVNKSVKSGTTVVGIPAKEV